jgi:hypothetical protein
MVCNYFHYESFIWYDTEENQITASRFSETTYRAAIVHSLREKFIQIARFTEPISPAA